MPPEALIINLFRYANGNATHQPASQPSRLDRATRATKGGAFSHPRQLREWPFPDTFYTLESFVCTTKGGFAAHIGLSKAFPHVCVCVCVCALHWTARDRCRASYANLRSFVIRSGPDPVLYWLGVVQIRARCVDLWA